MGETPFRRDQHYVPRGYLKRWALDGRVWTYRTLVSHSNVPLWKRSSPRGVAYHAHLYTSLVGGEATDKFERWLDREYETPAEEALQRATAGAGMTTADWRRLIRFLAAQDVRTPARFAEAMRRWDKTLPSVMDETLRGAAQKLEEAERTGATLPESAGEGSAGLPMRVVKNIVPGQEMGELGLEMVLGRGMWLWGIKHLLEKTSAVLHEHRWTILRPPEGFAWFTSDDPVVRLNFMSLTEYDFGGGWGSPGSEIFLPLGPQHLLYTQIGKRPPRRGERMPKAQAKLVCRFIAEHAHRFVFSQEPDAEIVKLRPRAVDADAFHREREQWAKWHDQQTAAELELLAGQEEL